MKLHTLSAICLAAFVSAPHLSTAQDAHSGHDHAEHGHAGHSHATEATGPHGGTVQTVGDRRIETVIAEKGIMFMILGQNNQPIAPPDAAGTLKLRVGESKKEYIY